MWDHISFSTYILYSETTDKFYIGSTQDLEKRLQRHNSKHMIATKAGVPWKVVWFQNFETRAEAYSKEMEIKKKKSRKYIEWLIDSTNVG